MTITFLAAPVRTTRRLLGAARRRGFSLMEILISVMILALGLLGLGAIFPAVIRAQRESVDTTLGVLAARTAESYMKGLEPRRMQSYGGELKRSGREFWFRQLVVYPATDNRRYAQGNVKESPAWAVCNGTKKFKIPVAVSAWRAMIRPVQYDVKGQQTPMEACADQYANLDGPDGQLGGDERDTNGAPMYTALYEHGEWYIPPIDGTGAGLIVGDPADAEADRLTFSIPVGSRLFPTGEDKDPQYVWDVAFQRVTADLDVSDQVTAFLPERDRYPEWAPLVDADYSLLCAPGKLARHDPRLSVDDGVGGEVEPGGDDYREDPSPLPEPIRAAIFVRRIDPRIRVANPDISLIEALTDRTIPQDSWRVPVGEDATGEPTLDGTDGSGDIRYSRLRTAGVIYNYNPGSGNALYRRRDILFMAPAVTDENFDFLTQAGQKFADNRGNVYTVVGSGGTGAERYLRVSPEVPASVTLASAQSGVINQIVFTPQVPVAVIVTEVAR